MELKAFLSLCLILSFSLAHLPAQTTSSSSEIIISEIDDLASIAGDIEWAFHEDVEDQKVYIDFAELGGNFSELVIQDTKGNELFKEDLLDLPSDSIYELDLSNFQSGDYTLELRTYNEPILRSISVK